MLPFTPCDWDKASGMRERIVRQMLGQKEVKKSEKGGPAEGHHVESRTSRLD